MLGSRTRLVNFLAAGTPVISTPVTELASALAAADVLIPFRVNDPDDLAHALKRAADLGPAGAQYLLLENDLDQKASVNVRVLPVGG